MDIQPGVIGQMMDPGQVVLTRLGRPTTPFPTWKRPIRTDAAATRLIIAVHAWLIENAIAEARAAGNELAELMFAGELPVKKPLPTASIDSANVFLFADPQ